MEAGTLLRVDYDGYNVYKVVQYLDKYMLLVCTEFYCDENLGDCIKCTSLGQQMWIAKFHEPNFSKLKW